MVFDRCPGVSEALRPRLLIVQCATCGNEVELFSDEERAKCDRCGAELSRAKEPSCLDWCKYAEECKAALKSG